VKIGVTGAAGFIGGALVPHLAARGHDLVLVDNGTGPLRVEHARWPVPRIDFTSPEGVRRLSECDVVLHLGAVSGVMACAQDPAGTARVNVEGTAKIVEACAHRGTPLAFASSLAVVGAPEALPVTERTPARPTHEYARQKAAGEKIVTEAGERGPAPSAVLRMSNVYGTYAVVGQTIAKGNVLNLFVRQAADGVLRVNAPGTQRRDFVHIDDVVAHWETIVGFLAERRGHPGSFTFNVASGESYSVLDIAGKVARAWAAAHPAAPALEIRVVPNPREGIELVDPEFSVSRTWTEERLALGCTRQVDEVVDGLVRAATHGGG
jgi:UDP-glucose 4-epimerase